jgi:hypothetical protein
MAGNSLIDALFHFSTIVLTAIGNPTISISPNEFGGMAGADTHHGAECGKGFCAGVTAF